MAAKATKAALADAKVPYDEIEQAFCGYVYGDSTCGQRARLRGRAHRHPGVQREQQLLDGLDRALARHAGDRGRARRVRARVGFEKMEKGALANKFNDRTNPLEKHVNVMNDGAGLQRRRRPPRRCSAAPGASTAGSTAPSARPSRKISEKARKHAVEEPVRALQQAALASRRSSRADEVFDPLTRYQCCPPTCGAAAAVLCSDEFAKKHGIASPVYIAAQAMTTDFAVLVRAEVDDQDGRLRHGQGRGEEGLREGRPRPRGRRRRRAPRLLHRERAPHLRGARALPRGRRREVHLGRRQHLRRQVRRRTRRAACSPRATRSARPASRSAPSSCGSSAGQAEQAPGARTRRSRSSTTWASAARAS